jgi:aminoglycoside 3'-phosphotransferase-2
MARGGTNPDKPFASGTCHGRPIAGAEPGLHYLLGEVGFPMARSFRELEIPAPLRTTWLEAGLREISIGRSRDRVFHLRDAQIFVKVSGLGRTSFLTHEYERLLWLEKMGVAAPRPLGWHMHDDRAWLVTSVAAGANAATSAASPRKKVGQIAAALRTLHGMKARECPFDERLEAKLAAAAGNVNRGDVDEADFDAEFRGSSARELLALAISSRPPGEEDIVVTRGDACMPNIMLDDEQFSAFVDCGRLGRADRYQDLALAARSIKANLGDEFVPAFFEAYGAPSPDERKLQFYRLLDEFF